MQYFHSAVLAHKHRRQYTDNGNVSISRNLYFNKAGSEPNLVQRLLFAEPCFSLFKVKIIIDMLNYIQSLIRFFCFLPLFLMPLHSFLASFYNMWLFFSILFQFICWFLDISLVLCMCMCVCLLSGLKCSYLNISQST